MAIDYMTTQNLELTFNLKMFNTKSTLASKFVTETESGKRLLRTNILNPLKNVYKIQDRQEVVREFMTKALFRSEVKSIITKFK